ncbi:Swarming motility protein YbiA [Thalassoglobus neptunius]|uniref:Swarming motility protein YbiA n=1 Tax=Thalassoglobus neptunius TaxID=1938619 RepID=A0A5C5WZY9_9PLAN|nr:NADAR family protein [Thalassoglobus neptunius]TWT55473.1 Swarming motility protein YbiA [Thalassoglobus neptunius]
MSENITPDWKLFETQRATHKRHAKRRTPLTILIRKVREQHGWLGNMSAHPVEWEGKKYRTTEALFQALRFDDPEVVVAIREQKSPMAAKMVAKKHKAQMTVEPMSEDDLFHMRLCLLLKVEQHPELKNRLLETGNEEIIEDCSKRKRGSALFWGAAFDGEKWVGDNQLGKLWMELREELQPTRCLAA